MGQHGSWPTVAITKEGYVIVVWSPHAFKNGSDLMYQVGQIDPYGSVNQSVTGLTAPAFWDSGFHTSIAINDSGVIVGMHETGYNSTGMYYRIGHLANPARGKYSITWDSGFYGIFFDDGINPHITLNNLNQVVESHQVPGESLLHYHRGTLSGGTINFQPSQRYDNGGFAPALALLDSGFVAELHEGEPGIFSRTGMLDPSDPALIDWTNSVRIGDNTGEYPAIATNRFFLLGTWVNRSGAVTRLIYSVAAVPVGDTN